MYVFSKQNARGITTPPTPRGVGRIIMYCRQGELACDEGPPVGKPPPDTESIARQTTRQTIIHGQPPTASGGGYTRRFFCGRTRPESRPATTDRPPHGHRFNRSTASSCLVRPSQATMPHDKEVSQLQWVKARHIEVSQLNRQPQQQCIEHSNTACCSCHVPIPSEKTLSSWHTNN